MPSGFGFPTVFVTSSIFYGSTVSVVKITVYFSGSIVFKISSDGGITWEDVSLVSGEEKTHTFTTPGTDVRFMAIGNSGATIETQFYNNSGRMQYPGIQIEASTIS